MRDAINPSPFGRGDKSLRPRVKRSPYRFKAAAPRPPAPPKAPVTERIVDKMGRQQCWENGVHVGCGQPPPAQQAPAAPPAQAAAPAPAAAPASGRPPAPAPAVSTGGRAPLALSLTPSKERAFTGQPIPVKNKLGKVETGFLGESIFIAYLKSQGKEDASTFPGKRNNLPLDLTDAEDTVFEAKTGLVSNGKTSQQWRMTIGEPGNKEKEWLAQAMPEQKAAHNRQKMQAIRRRKERMVKLLSKELGRPLKGKTITAIINPDTQVADLFLFDNWHERIGWNSEEAKKAYVGSYKYQIGGQQ